MAKKEKTSSEGKKSKEEYNAYVEYCKARNYYFLT